MSPGGSSSGQRESSSGEGGGSGGKCSDVDGIGSMELGVFALVRSEGGFSGEVVRAVGALGGDAGENPVSFDE